MVVSVAAVGAPPDLAMLAKVSVLVTVALPFTVVLAPVEEGPRVMAVALAVPMLTFPADANKVPVAAVVLKLPFNIHTLPPNTVLAPPPAVPPVVLAMLMLPPVLVMLLPRFIPLALEPKLMRPVAVVLLLNICIGVSAGTPVFRRIPIVVPLLEPKKILPPGKVTVEAMVLPPITKG